MNLHGTSANLRVFTDIDDTWLETARKSNPLDRVAVGALSKSGVPSSYLASRHDTLWRVLRAAAASVVPVTARSAEALARVQLELSGAAIVDFGATVLTAKGVPDLDWHAHLRTLALPRTDAELFDVLARDVLRAHPRVHVEQRVAGGLPAFVNFRGTPGMAPPLRITVERVLKEHGLRDTVYLHTTDRDVTVLPTIVSKGAAVEYFVAQYGWTSDVLLGCGDSLSDCSFLTSMDFALLPGGSRALTSLGRTALLQGELP